MIAANAAAVAVEVFEQLEPDVTRTEPLRHDS